LKPEDLRLLAFFTRHDMITITGLILFSRIEHGEDIASSAWNILSSEEFEKNRKEAETIVDTWAAMNNATSKLVAQ